MVFRLFPPSMDAKSQDGFCDIESGPFIIPMLDAQFQDGFLLKTTLKTI